MKVRYADKPDITGDSDQLNLGGIGEVLVWFGDGSADSEYMSALEVWLTQSEQWLPLNEAFRRHDLVTDNRDSHFFEPRTEADRDRGYALD